MVFMDDYLAEREVCLVMIITEASEALSGSGEGKGGVRDEV
jgi:hypothetical protein